MLRRSAHCCSPGSSRGGRCIGCVATMAAFQCSYIDPVWATQMASLGHRPGPICGSSGCRMFSMVCIAVCLGCGAGVAAAVMSMDCKTSIMMNLAEPMCQPFASIRCLARSDTPGTAVYHLGNWCNCSLASGGGTVMLPSAAWRRASGEYCHGANDRPSCSHLAFCSGSILPLSFFGAGRPSSDGAGVVRHGMRHRRVKTEAIQLQVCLFLELRVMVEAVVFLVLWPPQPLPCDGVRPGAAPIHPCPPQAWAVDQSEVLCISQDGVAIKETCEVICLSFVHHHVLCDVARPLVRYVHLHLADELTVCCKFLAFFTCRARCIVTNSWEIRAWRSWCKEHELGALWIMTMYGTGNFCRVIFEEVTTYHCLWMTGFQHLQAITVYLPGNV